MRNSLHRLSGQRGFVFVFLALSVIACRKNSASSIQEDSSSVTPAGKIVLKAANATTKSGNVFAMGYRHGSTEIAWLLEAVSLQQGVGVNEVIKLTVSQSGVTGELQKSDIRPPDVSPSSDVSVMLRNREKSIEFVNQYVQQHSDYLGAVESSITEYLKTARPHESAKKSVDQLQKKLAGLRSDGRAGNPDVPAASGGEDRAVNTVASHMLIAKPAQLRIAESALAAAIKSSDGPTYMRVMNSLKSWAMDRELGEKAYQILANHHDLGLLKSEVLRKLLAEIAAPAASSRNMLDESYTVINAIVLDAKRQDTWNLAIPALLLISRHMADPGPSFDTRPKAVYSRFMAGDSVWLKQKLTSLDPDGLASDLEETIARIKRKAFGD